MVQFFIRPVIDFGWFVRGRSRVLAAAVAALVAGVTALLVRRVRSERIELPDPGPLAAETAVSVHNAAKGSVIAAVREHDGPDHELVVGTVKEAVRDAAGAGADVTAVALGAVEGAADVAHLVHAHPRELASLAARAAVDAAAAQGETAGARVRDLLAGYVTL